MSKELIDKLIASLPIIGDRNYKFLRTYGGETFEYFIDKNVVSIGWNQITINDIKNFPEEQVKDKIRRIYFDNNPDYTDKARKQQAALAYGKLEGFCSLKKGDVIIVPSHKSDFLAFGIIDDDDVFNASEEGLIGNRDVKRHKVIWKKVADIRTLDSIFWKVKSNMHSLSSVKKYADYIDAVMDEAYFKQDNIHQIINVKSNDKINFGELTRLFTLHKEILTLINEKYELGELDEINSTNVQLSLNSPGLINLATPKGKAAAVFVFLLFFTSCNDQKQFGDLTELGEQADTEILEKIQEYQTVKDTFDAKNEINYFAE